MCRIRLLRALIGNKHVTESVVAVHVELFTAPIIHKGGGHPLSMVNDFFTASPP